jgi:Zn-dependent oligopeptidase
MMNPLLSSWNGPFSSAPFSKIKNSHFLPAIKEAIVQAKKEIETIKENKETSFENTVVALDRSGHQLDLISSVFFNLHSAESNDELQDLAQEISPLLTQYGNDIILDQDLFTKVKLVYDNEDRSSLTEAEKMLLKKTYKSFVRNGALLNETDKIKLREIDQELSKIKLEFGNHVLEETQRFEKHIVDETLLKGLPPNAIEAAKMEAEQREKEGWVFTLDFPSYQAVLKYADDRNFRKEMHLAFNSKAFKGDKLDNKAIVLKIAKLRNQRAKLLGYQTHAHFVLEERMAKTPAKVTSFLNQLYEKAFPIAKKEMEELLAFAQLQGFRDELQSFDTAYYAEKLKQSLFNIDDEALKPYFSLDKVIEGAFGSAQLLYGIKFIERFDIDKYHSDVKTFEVLDANGDHLAVFYADFFPRKGKRAGAWMTSFQDQYEVNGKDHRPHISIVCNFNKPTKDLPSLLTFNEVTTLFHEFGHALHGILSKTPFKSISGTSVYWDFVELPSQIMENWCFEKESLDRFARHYKSGELIPDELIAGIKASSNFMEATATMRQISFGLLDMAWHGDENIDHINDGVLLEDKAMESTRLLTKIEGTNTSCQFSHIFSGGYSAGYYSYKWSEVLDADAFEYFKEKGIFDQDVAKAFRKLLSSGGSIDPEILYREFRGRDASVDALLKRAGIS